VFFIGVIIFFACAGSPQEATFFVSPTGKDTNPGTFRRPFATLAKARDTVRLLKKTQREGNITVLIRGGTYTLTETVVFDLKDSGSKNQVITYAAYPGEEPVFSSGFKITGWKKLEREHNALSEVARDNVWVADLPETRGGYWRFFTLFDGETSLPRARSDGFKPMDDERNFWGQGFWGMTFASPVQKSVLYFPQGRLRNWLNLEDVEIFIFPQIGYTMNILGLASVDEETGEAWTTIPATYAMNPVNSFVNPIEKMIDAPLRQESVWVENVLEGLDEPGEWVLNTREGRLYLWPRGEVPGDQIVAPRLRELIRIEGDVEKDGPVDIPVRHLVFRGLTFTHGDRDLWTKDDAGIQHDWEMYDKSTALLRFRATEHCLVDECRFTNSGGTGVRFDLHSQYNRVQRSLFDYLGQSGILICGYGPGTKDVSYHNEVINNHVHHCGEIYKHSHGIIIWQSGENRVANNLIHDMPRKAVLVAGVRYRHFDPRYRDNRECSRLIRWNEVDDARGYDYTVSYLHVRNNVVENNEIYKIMEVGEDGGGINITGAAEGNIIRRNRLYDIKNTMADAAIRLDGTGRGTLITENIIYDCALPAINSRDINNYIENNIMVDVSTRRQPNQEGYFMFGRESTTRFQRNILYHSGRKAPFLLRLRGAKLNQFKSDFNIYYSAGNPGTSSAFLRNQREDGIESHGVSADPLFINVKKRDFRLQPNSPAFKLGFKQIDTNQIGLTEDFPERFR